MDKITDLRGQTDSRNSPTVVLVTHKILKVRFTKDFFFLAQMYDILPQTHLLYLSSRHNGVAVCVSSAGVSARCHSLLTAFKRGLHE